MRVKYQNRIPLSRIYQHYDYQSPIKRKIIISHQKLPKDFFPQKSKIICDSMQDVSRPHLLSQNIRRNYSNIQNSRFLPKRQSMTARQLRLDNNQQDLISGIISATQQIKRVIRKHSVQLNKKQNKDIASFNLTIQAIKKTKNINCLELPPLIMKKKELTTPF